MSEKQILVNEFFSRMHYGSHIQVDSDSVQRFGLTLLKIVSGDGLSDRERWAFEEIGRHVGAPEEMIKAVSETDVSQLDVADMLAGFADGNPARTMLYDAITIASVDGYGDKERALAAQAAELLNIDDDVLRSLEALVESERTLRQLKAALLMSPAGV